LPPKVPYTVPVAWPEAENARPPIEGDKPITLTGFLKKQCALAHIGPNLCQIDAEIR
jgi:hypothetical protein